MNAPGEALLNHLRADLELKSEIIRALRAERERDAESTGEQALLMAAVGAELHQRATALSLMAAERDPGAVQRAAGRLAVLSADVAEYAAAKAGRLVLARAPVHLRQLLSCVEGLSALRVRLASNVPERVVTDMARLSVVLRHFAEQCAQMVGSPATTLEVSCSGEAAAGARVQLQFSLSHSLADGGERANSDSTAATPVRLRGALARALCELMGATLSLTSLTLPFEVATDQAHTGRFRLALAEGSLPAVDGAADTWSASDPAPASDVRRNDDASIDLLYLDRQLGSLAPVILERTAPAFIAHAQRRMTDLHVAREVEDLKRLRNVAHAWKGSALSVGAIGLATLLEGIEKQAEANRSPGPGPIWQVRSSLDRVLRALDKYGDLHRSAT
jgi:HPt (histidine-containing phosphotransfer) domain-containing protein